MSEPLLFVSDVHVHNFRTHSRVLADGTNSRLANAVGVLAFLSRYCRREGIRHVLCGRLDSEVFYQARAAFRALAQAVDRLVIIVGNHDQSPTNDREHALGAVNDFTIVADTPQKTALGRATLAAFPFMRDGQEHRQLFKAYNRSSVDAVSTHVGVAGVPGRTCFIAEPVQRRHLATRAGVVLLGHYHDYAQVAETAYYAGSAQALEWGDANRGKYALRVELGTGGPRVMPLPLPGIRFLEFSHPDELARRQAEVPGNIVRAHAPVEDVKALRARLAGFGAHDVQIVPLRCAHPRLPRPERRCGPDRRRPTGCPTHGPCLARPGPHTPPPRRHACVRPFL